MLGLEETKLSLDNDRAKLQNQLRDSEKDQLQVEHNLQSLQEQLQRAQVATSQQQAEEKDLQARLLNESEERERCQQELHQLKKQVSFEHVLKLFLGIYGFISLDYSEGMYQDRRQLKIEYRKIWERCNNFATEILKWSAKSTHKMYSVAFQLYIYRKTQAL